MKLQVFLLFCILGSIVSASDLSAKLRRERRFLGSIKKAFDKVVDTAKDVVDKVVDTGKDVVDTVKDKGKDVIDTVKDTGKDVIDTVKDTGKDVIDTVKDKGKDVVDDIVDVGKDVIGKVVDVTDDIIDSIAHFTVKGYKFTKNKFKKTYKKAKEAFKKLGDVVKGFDYDIIVDNLIGLIDSSITVKACTALCQTGANTVFTAASAGTLTAVGAVASLACKPACEGGLAVLEDLAESAVE